MTVITVDPFRCRMWHLHERLGTSVTLETCRAEIDSFMQHGQLIPVLARRLVGDERHDFELICGARRLFVAQHLNRALALQVREMSDREAIVAMEIENRHRKDISPYERGLSYARWLRGGYFKCQDELAAHLTVSASQVSRLLKMARLPSIVVNAFGSGREICETWGCQLAEALEDPERRRTLIRRARQICGRSPRPRPANAFRQIMAAVAGRRLARSVRDEIVAGSDNSPLFRIKYQRESVMLLLPEARISDDILEEIKGAVAQILRDASWQRVEPVSISDEERAA
jgi:ParB family chromosome partitioning protein